MLWSRKSKDCSDNPAVHPHLGYITSSWQATPQVHMALGLMPFVLIMT